MISEKNTLLQKIILRNNQNRISTASCRNSKNELKYKTDLDQINSANRFDCTLHSTPNSFSPTSASFSSFPSSPSHPSSSSCSPYIPTFFPPSSCFSRREISSSSSSPSSSPSFPSRLQPLSPLLKCFQLLSQKMNKDDNCTYYDTTINNGNVEYHDDNDVNNNNNQKNNNNNSNDNNNNNNNSSSSSLQGMSFITEVTNQTSGHGHTDIESLSSAPSISYRDAEYFSGE